MKFGILTGGGDAPGLNGIIETCARGLFELGHEVYGIRDGFEGVFERNYFKIEKTRLVGIHAESGTILGTSNKSRIAGRESEFIECFKALNLDALIVAGGDGTFSALQPLRDLIPIIGMPKTIDNDLCGTELTFGYDTACGVVAEAVDSLRFTANAHRRVLIVETMGRTAGWIALGGGLASFSDAILLPELPYDEAALKQFILSKKSAGQRGLMVCVAEGAYAKGSSPRVAFTVENSPQKERFGGISEVLARWVERETQWESRHIILGHLQRSKHPSTTDRFLTLSMGAEAVKLAHAKHWGQAVVYKDGAVTTAPIESVMGPARLVPADHKWIEYAHSIGIFI
jgi:ATP-dependent phosphofructokinase / diphosphate-dependent phosphofructokinase